jgi:hypothetical protein
MQFRLIPDWKHAWRWSSVRLVGVAAGMQITLMAFPQQLQANLPPWLLQGASILCLVGAALGRITTTEPQHEPTVPPQ